MENVVQYLTECDPVWAAFLATTFTWLVTAAGAGLVFLFKQLHRKWLDGMLGFTGGVMIAASFWSLLSPAIEMSPGEGLTKAMPAAIGFFAGAMFLYGIDKLIPHLHLNFPANKAEGINTVRIDISLA